MISFSPYKYRSHCLIIIMVIVFLLGFIFPNLLVTFGFHSASLFSHDYIVFLTQLLVFQFLHGDILHLLFNAYFLYVIGPEVEARMSKVQFSLFFLGSTLFVALGLVLLEDPYVVTVGISGFCMALLSYLWVDLKNRNNPEANQIMILLAANIAIWLIPGISMVWHLAGAVFGLLYWYLKKSFWR